MSALNEIRLVWRWRAGIGGFAASAAARAARSALLDVGQVNVPIAGEVIGD